MKILSSSQTQQADQYTIANEPIASIDLMERASTAFVNKFNELFPDSKSKIIVLCGTGNNGGDGLAIARLLHKQNRKVEVFTIGNLDSCSPDFRINYDKLPDGISNEAIEYKKNFPETNESDIVIDGLFGSGLTRPIEGIHAQLVKHINQSPSTKVSIDIASGLFADQSTVGSKIIHPSYTISFQLPKLAFFQPSLHEYVGKWYVVDIGLNEEFIRETESDYYLTETRKVKQLIPKREKFNHKGDAGRLLIVAGSKGKMGAAILATQAGFRAGAGLINVNSPSCGINILQTAVPEAMVLTDSDAEYISKIEIPKATSAIAIGPGIDTKEVTANALNQALTSFEKPIVLDADALNILSANPEWIKTVPEDSILTPHPGEFERLVGKWTDDFDKLNKLQRFCIDNKVNMVLKGAFSAVCCRHGKIHFNPTGNPGMATAGSGDVLTGVIGALLAQGLNPFDSLQLGVFIHGLSGDLASKKYGELSMKASDIIEMIPKAIRDIQSS